MGLEPHQTGFGAGQWLVFATHPALIANAVQVIEQEAVVDFASARLMAARVIGQLDMVDVPQVRLHGAGQIALHDLHVVDVVLQEQVGAADLFLNGQGLFRVVQVKARDVEGVDRLHDQLDARRL